MCFFYSAEGLFAIKRAYLLLEKPNLPEKPSKN
jgi:hypothetical protein